MISIIYEDNHLIAINKKSGDLVQADKTNDLTLIDKIKSYIKKKYNKKGNVFLGVIHRLDRPTSGIVIFAKTSKALKRMNELFKNKLIKKIYLAIVEKPPPEISGTLINNLTKNNKKNKSFVTKEGKKSILFYKMIRKTNNYYLLELTPKTGRHHQIRTQLSNIGSIIKGDLKYGAKRNNLDGSICLHAYKLEFLHPVKNERISLIAETPKSKIWRPN